MKCKKPSFLTVYGELNLLSSVTRASLLSLNAFKKKCREILVVATFVMPNMRLPTLDANRDLQIGNHVYHASRVVMNLFDFRAPTSLDLYRSAPTLVLDGRDL